VAWANAFLDAQRVRQLSLRSLRAYAFDLLHFARWFEQAAQPLPEITGSTLLDYVCHQLDREPPPALQHIMGHSQIHTTLLYVHLAPQDIWREYARAVDNRTRLANPQIP